MADASVQGQPAVFSGSLLLIAANTGFCLSILSRTRRICVSLNLMQIILFGVLNWQLAGAFGEDHYRYDRPPRFYDWAAFAFDVYGRRTSWMRSTNMARFKPSPITCAASGILLVAMHLTVDVFLVGLALRWARRFWGEPRTNRLQKERREFGWALIALSLFLGFGLRRT